MAKTALNSKSQPSSVVDKPNVLAKQISLAELCRRLVMDSYAPAAVLIDTANACVFSMGPTDRYLRIAPGYPTTDLLEMATPALKIKIRSALQKAKDGNKRVTLDGGRSREKSEPFKIDIQPVTHEGIGYYLVCFVETHTGAGGQDSRRSHKGSRRART